MKKPTLRNVVSSPWMILILLAVGWGPIFIAEWVRLARPDLDAEYAPQSFALGWMAVTIVCSVSAIAYTLVHGILLIVRLLRDDDDAKA